MGARARSRGRPRPRQGLAQPAPRRGGRGIDVGLIFDAVTFAVAFAIALALYPSLIRALRRAKAGQVIQQELPETHQKKAGTPTGGGILFVALALIGGVLA